MKVLFVSSDHSLSNSLEKKLAQTDCEIVRIEQVSCLLEHLEKDSGIHTLLLDVETDGFNQIVENVQKLPGHTFIIGLMERSRQDELSHIHFDWLDGIINFDDTADCISHKLSNIKNFLFTSQKLNEQSFEPNFLNGQQTYNIMAALEYVNNEKGLLKELYEIIIENINGFELVPNLKDENIYLNELIQNAAHLGLERLCCWMEFVKNVIQCADKFYRSNCEFFQKTQDQLRIELAEGMECLKDSGFFIETQEDADPLFKARVLLVEDMPYNRILINKFLEKHESIIVEATNGLEAIEIWEKEAPFDLIIMDMNMPVMDGFTATQKIRELEKIQGLPTIPIIALTALAMRGDREKCLSAGCDEYLSKPVDSVALLETCQNMLSLKIPAQTLVSSEETTKSFKIERIILKSENQVYQFCLENIIRSYGIDLELETSEALIIRKAKTMDRSSLMLLDGDSDFELAYYLKEKFPEKNVALIINREKEKSLLLQKSPFHIHYPFENTQILEVFDKFSEKIYQADKQAEIIKDVASLQDLKSQVNIKEMVQKSDGQLAVWQKSFRKIGGDLVLSQQFNYHGRFGLVLADVAGHDIKSGYTASWFSGLIEGVWAQHSVPVELLSYLNQLFEHDSEEEDKRFVCALALLWDRIRCKLYFANAGIPGGILVKKDTGKEELIDWKGVPIGMFPDIERFDNGCIDFHPGDRLYMATDGVLESIPNEVFLDINKSKSDSPAQEALEAIVDFVKRSIQVTDDLTIAVLEAKEFPIPNQGFRVSIKSTFEEVDRAIQEIETHVQTTMPDHFNWTMISVAIREALINAVEHGNKAVENAPVDIDVGRNGDNMVLIVSDLGGGFDLASVKKRLQNEGALRIHGRGIEMMENICEKVEFLGGGIYLEFAPKKD